MKVQPIDKDGNPSGAPIEVNEGQWEIMKRTFGKRLRLREIPVPPDNELPLLSEEEAQKIVDEIFDEKPRRRRRKKIDTNE